jgi:hypothetical protein
MKFTRLFFNLSAFLVAMLAGRQTALAIFHPQIEVESIVQKADPSGIRASELVPTPPISEQVSFFVVHISNPAGSPTILKGIWWVALTPQAPIILQPIYPMVGTPTESVKKLADSFILLDAGDWRTLDQFADMEVGFFTELTQMNIPAQGYILADDEAFAILIDLLGGINLEGNVSSGRQVVSALPDAQATPESAIRLQTELWNGLCEKAVFTGSAHMFSLVQSELQQHIYTSPAFPLNLAAWQAYITSTNIPGCKINPAQYAQ